MIFLWFPYWKNGVPLRCVENTAGRFWDFPRKTWPKRTTTWHGCNTEHGRKGCGSSEKTEPQEDFMALLIAPRSFWCFEPGTSPCWVCKHCKAFDCTYSTSGAHPTFKVMRITRDKNDRNDRNDKVLILINLNESRRHKNFYRNIRNMILITQRYSASQLIPITY